MKSLENDLAGPGLAHAVMFVKQRRGRSRRDCAGGVERTLYCTTFGGGEVDITSGNFVFTATESYLIEGEKLTRPVRGATLIGNGPEALKYVSAVGHDLELDEGVSSAVDRIRVSHPWRSVLGCGLGTFVPRHAVEAAPEPCVG